MAPVEGSIALRRCWCSAAAPPREEAPGLTPRCRASRRGVAPMAATEQPLHEAATSCAHRRCRSRWPRGGIPSSCEAQLRACAGRLRARARAAAERSHSSRGLILVLAAALCASGAWAARPSAPAEWALPGDLGGVELYRAMVSSGGVNTSMSGNYSEEGLLRSLGLPPDGDALPHLNMEALMARLIWQQRPQQAIDMVFNLVFPPPPPPPPAASEDGASSPARRRAHEQQQDAHSGTDNDSRAAAAATAAVPQSVIDAAAVTAATYGNGHDHAPQHHAGNASSSLPGAGQQQQAPLPKHLAHLTIANAHPTLQQAVLFLLRSPQAVNQSFNHINDLAHRPVWLAVHQIQAIAKGRGACVPPGTVPGAMPPDAGAGQQRRQKHRRLHLVDEQPAAGAEGGGVLHEVGPEAPCVLADELRTLRWLLTQLPRKCGLPLLRRMLVAALLQRRAGMLHAFLPEEQRQIMLLFLQFYASHRDAATHKSVVEFFHISKAGGTSMCSLSTKNGCTTWDAGEKRNCLVYEFDDLPHWVSRAAHGQLTTNRTWGAWFINYETERNQVFCARRRQFMMMNGWDMYAHEYTLVGGRVNPRGVQLCSDMVTMLQVRHPYTRLVSHLRWIYGLYHQRQTHDEVLMVWPNTSSAHWQFMAPAVVDNYYTRSLLGEKVYHFAPGDVTEEQGTLAQLLVAQYDVLLVLEQAISRRLGLGLGLGWTHAEQDEKQRSADELMARVLAARAQAQQANATTASATPAAATVTTDKAASGDGEPQRRRLHAATESAASTLSSSSSSTTTTTTTATSSSSTTVAGSNEAAVEKLRALIRAATQPGVPADLGELLALNQVDLHLYQFTSWMARFDAAVLETVRLVLPGQPYAGLPTGPSQLKQKARERARRRKESAVAHAASMAALNGVPAGAPSPPPPPPPVDQRATCGFVGY